MILVVTVTIMSIRIIVLGCYYCYLFIIAMVILCCFHAIAGIAFMHNIIVMMVLLMIITTTAFSGI